MSSTRDIQAKWRQKQSVLGNMIGSEQDAGFGGRFQIYEHGRIYWHSLFGAHEVHGDILGHYLADEGPGNPVTGNRVFGFPVDDEAVTPDGLHPVGYFEFGVIFLKAGIARIDGEYYAAWKHWGAELEFGYPISQPFQFTGGEAAFFERGCFWKGPASKFKVKGMRLKPPQLGQPALVGLDAQTFALDPIIFTGNPDVDLSDPLRDTLPDVYRNLWGGRLFLRSVEKEGEPPHEVLLATLDPTTTGPAFRGLHVSIQVQLVADSLRDRTLYDLCIHKPEGGTVVLASHSFYAKAKWDNFGFIHATDLHVSRRVDGFRKRLYELGLEKGAEELNSFSDGFRDFIKDANQLHDAGKLDVILATGDIVDYVFEDRDHRDGPGNFGFFESLILGNAPYPEGHPSEELRVPIFTSLGNHDYRANAYPLMFELTWQGIELTTISNFESLNLTVQETVRLVNGKWIHVTGGSNTYPPLPRIPDVKNLNKDEANDIAALDPGMINNSSYYFRRINPDSSYIVRAGERHRFVMLDSGPDVGIVKGFGEAIWAALGNGDEDKRTFIGGGPNSEGIEPTELELVKLAQTEAAGLGLVVVGIHAPLVNIKGNEYAHYFRETEHPTADPNEVNGFVFRYQYGQFANVSPGTNPSNIESDWIRTGTEYFKQGSVEDLLDDGISRGKTEDLLLICVGQGTFRQVDLVLSGHKHLNVELGLGYDRDHQKLRFFHDYYTESPGSYYPSTGIENNDFRQSRSINIEVEDQAALGQLPIKISDPPLPSYLLLKVPLYKTMLNDTADEFVAFNWWRDHRPLLLQTGALGPMENNQRPDRNQHPDLPPDPQKPGPTFQGFRLVSVQGNTMTRIHYLKTAGQQMIRRSYREVFGREPLQPELDAWVKRVKERPIDYRQVVLDHVDYLLSSTGSEELSYMVDRSYRAVFGREPNSNELADWISDVTAQRIGYDQVVSNHLDFMLSANGSQELTETINRSYLNVLNREPRADELAAWEQGVRDNRYQYWQLVEANKMYKMNGGT